MLNLMTDLSLSFNIPFWLFLEKYLWTSSLKWGLFYLSVPGLNIRTNFIGSFVCFIHFFVKSSMTCSSLFLFTRDSIFCLLHTHTNSKVQYVVLLLESTSYRLRGSTPWFSGSSCIWLMVLQVPQVSYLTSSLCP